MKVIMYPLRLIKNLLSFLVELSRHDAFYWRNNSRRAENCFIDSTAVLYGNFTLRQVTIDYATYISPNANILNTTIGKFCSIGPNLVCGWGIHPINGISTHPAFYSSSKKSTFTLCETDNAVEYQPITIGNDVFIGANVTILDGVTIGDGAVIGAGAVVSKDVPAYAIAVGCPAKVVKYRFNPEQIRSLLDCEWWNNKYTFEAVRENFYHVDDFISKALTEEN